MKLYTILCVLFVFKIAFVFAGENGAKSQLARRIQKRYENKIEERAPVAQRCPYFGCADGTE